MPNKHSRIVRNLYVALSGGSTPQAMFSIIAKEYAKAFTLGKLHFFWVDERCVPASSSESNFGMQIDFCSAILIFPKKIYIRFTAEKIP
jgi:6-phosphogluconolactonase